MYVPTHIRRRRARMCRLECDFRSSGCRPEWIWSMLRLLFQLAAAARDCMPNALVSQACTCTQQCAIQNLASMAQSLHTTQQHPKPSPASYRVTSCSLFGRSRSPSCTQAHASTRRGLTIWSNANAHPVVADRCHCVCTSKSVDAVKVIFGTSASPMTWTSKLKMVDEA
jgi:hypothetical protein